MCVLSVGTCNYKILLRRYKKLRCPQAIINSKFAASYNTMYKNRYKQSAVSKSFWLGMAVFFIVFSSCPVRKYIRLQLYKHVPLTETSSTSDHFKIKDIKDCCIAEKNEQTPTVVFHFLKGSVDHGLNPFCFNTASSLTGLDFFKRNERSLVLFKPPSRTPSSIPLYLQVRRLQV